MHQKMNMDGRSMAQSAFRLLATSVRASCDLYEEVVKITRLHDKLAVVVGYPQGLCKGFVLFAERNHKVSISNVNTYIVAYSRLRCRKIVDKISYATVANVTEAYNMAHS